eukprot:GILJ01017428.1.p1 GENE.GILJ01017428.1~~GILJ01017428.1.p1  ORF type:complete len:265 (-),score=19.50 GILJ01017428.1:375-1169(-)
MAQLVLWESIELMSSGITLQTLQWLKKNETRIYKFFDETFPGIPFNNQFAKFCNFFGPIRKVLVHDNVLCYLFDYYFRRINSRRAHQYIVCQMCYFGKVYENRLKRFLQLYHGRDDLARLDDQFLIDIHVVECLVKSSISVELKYRVLLRFFKTKQLITMIPRLLFQHIPLILQTLVIPPLTIVEVTQLQDLFGTFVHEQKCSHTASHYFQMHLLRISIPLYHMCCQEELFGLGHFTLPKLYWTFYFGVSLQFTKTVPSFNSTL